MYWDRYIHRNNPRRIEPLDRQLDTYIMLDVETTGLHADDDKLIEIGAMYVTPGNESNRPTFEQLVNPQRPLPEFITQLTDIDDPMLEGQPTAATAMAMFHRWMDDVWPADQPLTVIAHNAEFDVSFLDAAERAYDPAVGLFECRWMCTKEMSWELNPQKRHHRVADLIVDYRIGDVEAHRALSDTMQEQMIYMALCDEATRRGAWNQREGVANIARKTMGVAGPIRSHGGTSARTGGTSARTGTVMAWPRTVSCWAGSPNPRTRKQVPW